MADAASPLALIGNCESVFLIVVFLYFGKAIFNAGHASVEMALEGLAESNDVLLVSKELVC